MDAANFILGERKSSSLGLPRVCDPSLAAGLSEQPEGLGPVGEKHPRGFFVSRLS